MTVRTYGQLVFEGDHWRIAALEPHVSLRLKQMFPKVPKTAEPPYRLPADRATAADLDWFLSRYPLAGTDDDLAQLREGRLQWDADVAERERILAPDYQPPFRPGFRDGLSLRPYQAQAVDMLGAAKGLIVGDEVGLGKTVVGAGACLLPRALPAAIVCQAHLQSQWIKEIERFTSLTTHAIKGTRPYSLPPADVYIWRYTQLAGWSNIYRTLGLGLVAFDEIQELRKGQDTEKGRASAIMCRVSRYRLGLTATLVYNYSDEAHSLFSFIRPEVLGSREDFMLEWADKPKELGSFLREQHAFIRRTKPEVGRQLPPVNKIVETVDYSILQLREAEALARVLAIKATQGVPIERGQAARDLDALMRQATGVAKAKAVAAFVRVLVEGGTPVVLLGWHRGVYDIWLEQLKDLKPAMYTGSETAVAKDWAKHHFVTGATDILILSLRSGAGLDGLQHRASTVVFGELDWSPGVHHQCIGRLDRDGQKDPVTAFFLVAEEGSDPPMMEVLGLKASEAAHIVDPHLGVQAAHSDRSHLQTLVRRYLDKKGVADALDLPEGGDLFGEGDAPASDAESVELGA